MPRVFLSYSHEEPEHNKWVMDLGKLLRENGVDAYLDKWDLIPGQDIHVWEKEASGRFEYLCSSRLNKEKENPFSNGYWQASFVLLSKPDITSLKDFLEKLRESETGRTGWDIGWVPTRSGIAPYPFQEGIEV